MGKRFTETNKWDDPWFRKLPSKYKIFWQYLLDKCDNAGVWIKDFEAFEFFSSEKAEESEALRFINEGKERVQILNTGSRWLVVDFVAFQFGKLNEESRVHRSVLALQTKMVEKGYLKGINTLKDKDKNKDKEKDKDFIGELKSNPAYSHINIDFELGKMDAWLLANKGRQKTKRFVLRWLNKIEKPLEINKPINNTDEQIKKDREKHEKMIAEAEANPITAEQRAELRKLMAGIGNGGK